MSNYKSAQHHFYFIKCKLKLSFGFILLMSECLCSRKQMITNDCEDIENRKSSLFVINEIANWCGQIGIHCGEFSYD